MRIIGRAITLALVLAAGSACAATIQDEFKRVIDESRRTDVSVTPAQALMYHGLGLVQEEEFAEAIPFLEEAIARDPALEAGWEGLGWSYVRTGQQKRARDLWFRMRDLMPEKAKPVIQERLGGRYRDVRPAGLVDHALELVLNGSGASRTGGQGQRQRDCQAIYPHRASCGLLLFTSCRASRS